MLFVWTGLTLFFGWFVTAYKRNAVWRVRYICPSRRLLVQNIYAALDILAQSMHDDFYRERFEVEVFGLL